MEVRSHLLMKRLWSEELRHQAIGEEQGRQRGRWMAALEAGLLVQEDHLEDQHRKLESVRLAAVKNEAGLELQDPGAPPPAVLQTYAVPLQRVRQELAAWVPPMTDEYQSLIEGTRTLSPTTMEELEQDPLYEAMEVAPGMLVPTIKAPHGKKRARIVVCGNRLEALDGSGAATSGKEEAQNLYAGGADGTTIRCLLRKAAAMSWGIATCDVKTAFLLAPREDSSRRLVVVKPPRILVEAGIVGPQELWRVQHALYGLRSSPADWATYRNRLMRSFQWQHEGRTLELRETPEPNLWKIVERRPLDQEEPPPKGFIGVYVDDFIVVGAKDIVKGALGRIEMEWKCSPAEWVNSERWTKFSGFELRWSSAEGLYVGQQAYIQELLSRHPSVTPTAVPFQGVPNEEPEAEVTLEDVRRAQGVVGELLWVSVRSRPDLAYGVAWMGRQVTRTPKRVLEYGCQMLGYLKTTLSWSLHYGRARSSIPAEHYQPTMRVDVLSDASFGPPSGRGCQGVIGTYGGEPVQYESRQQAFCTVSSAEAELLGYTEAMTMGDSLAALTNVLEGTGDGTGTECRLGGDNQAGLRILEAPDGPWRTRHLRLRAHALRERVKWGAWKVIHIPGQHLVADFLTKPIGVAARWQHFFAAMGMKPVVEASSESLGSKVARIAALVGGLAGVLTWRPSGPTGKAAQSLAVAAMVASLATSCDSKKRATGPTRSEYVDPPYGLQDQVREDEPTCSRDDGSEEEPDFEPSPEGSRDYAVDVSHGTNSESSSAERPDWRRTMASEDEEPPTLDEMIAQGWRVVRSNLAPPNREIYRGPNPVLPPAEDPNQETPTWMGVSTQMPVRPRSNDPWEPRRGFSGTSRVREDSSQKGVLNSSQWLEPSQGECDSGSAQIEKCTTIPRRKPSATSVFIELWLKV